MSRLDVSTTPEMLKEHFITEGIEVSKVEQKSNNEAHFKSFKVSVKSAEDFDKLLSGDHIPKYTQVRKWIYYRKNDKATHEVPITANVNAASSISSSSNQLQVMGNSSHTQGQQGSIST